MSSSAKPDSSFALIGIDGGATEVRTHHVVVEGSPPDAVFRLGEASASRRYERVVGFRPVDTAEQFRQRGAAELNPVEVEQGRCYVQAACDSVRDVARQLDRRRVLIGMGMPGLKTADGRGIEVINNGPRIPDFLDDLEQGLHDADLELAAPVFRLGSDADYCGMGEEYARDGMFRDVQNAYYLGGGTGLADAMKLMGRLVPFDEAKPWLQKAWQIPSRLGPTFEKLASAQGMLTVYANLLGESPSTLAQANRFPESEAHRGDVVAESTLEMVALVLAELLFERIGTVHRGRTERPHRGQAYLDLTIEHPYRGVALERIVIGQRIGAIYADPRFAEAFKHKLDRCLARFLMGLSDKVLASRYLDGEALRPGVIVASRLREAPALGAAIDAFRAHFGSAQS